MHTLTYVWLGGAVVTLLVLDGLDTDDLDGYDDNRWHYLVAGLVLAVLWPLLFAAVIVALVIATFKEDPL